MKCNYSSIVETKAMALVSEGEAAFTHSSPATSSLANDDVNGPLVNLKKKTPLQLQTLENLYTDDKFPSQSRLEDYAFALGLNYKQVSGWFIQRRRKDKIKKTGIKNKNKRGKENHYSDDLQQGEDETVRRPGLLQDMLYSPDYILKKVFRKDGPPLGVDFDPLPSTASLRCRNSHGNMQHGTGDMCPSTSDGDERLTKRRKVPRSSVVGCQQKSRICTSVKKHGKGKGLMTAWQVANADNRCPERNGPSRKQKVLPRKNSAPLQRHGIGKGLMTAWRLMNPDSGVCRISDRQAVLSQITTNPKSRRPVNGVKRPQRRKPVPLQGRLGKRKQNKKTVPLRRRKVGFDNNEDQRVAWRTKCGLALEADISEACHSLFATLMDDEELELMELQAGPNPLTCSDHFPNSGGFGCPLCKGLLAKFPPESVRMKQLISMQPWVSSLELLKKLFKVFHFLCTYAVTLNVCPFTLDEFVQAFHDKDSLLLGKIHVCLLELLLSDVEKELYDEAFQRSRKNCIFLNLLHSVENQKSVLNLWKKSLNPLTWVEILRQVLIAAGFGSKDGILRKEGVYKEVNPLVKYGLRPGTLKGELFRILLEHGNKGMKVSDLVTRLQIVGLYPEKEKDGLEGLICSTLSSDITLFEKISNSAFRLRVNSLTKEDEDTESDSEDSGSIDDCEGNREVDSENPILRKNDVPNPGIEIDESHPGEAWILGLKEGEYSDLGIEEKLNALDALVELLSASSSIRTEFSQDPPTALAEHVPKLYQHGSGAKVKRLLANKQRLWSSTCQSGLIYSSKRVHSSSDIQTIDSSILGRKENSPGDGLHTMQSLFLGSDRRYNKYWLFLGPCDTTDPGHRRVYFESSEDGHWEVIDTEEVLSALMAALDKRGRREAELLASLEKRTSFLYEQMSSSVATDAACRQPTRSDQSELDLVNEDGSSPVFGVDSYLHLTEILPNSMASAGAIVFNVEQKQRRSCMQAFDLWIWNTFYSNLFAVKHKKCSYFDSLTRCESCHDLYWRDEKHCRFCHTTFELDFDLEERYAIHVATCRDMQDADMQPKHKLVPSQLQALKAAIHATELAMPDGAMIGAWSKSAHKLWAKRLRRTSNLHELAQVLTDFVNAINVDWWSQCYVSVDCDSTLEEIVACFTNIPRTSSAFAFWLVKLDAFIAFHSRVAQEAGTEE